MGLFIGASILTVLELFDYAYEVSTSAIPWLRGGTKSAPPQSPLFLQGWHNPILPLAPRFPGAGRARCGVLGHSLHLGHGAEPFVSLCGAEMWLS